MARIVDTKTNPIITLSIHTVMNDGTRSSIELGENDIVNDLRYIENGEIKKISGRVDKIQWKYYPTSRDYSSVTKLKSNFSADVLLDSVIIDSSEEYHSKVLSIPSRMIIEKEDIKDVFRIEHTLQYASSFEVLMTDGTVNEFFVKEGQELLGLTYLYKNKEYTIDCRLVAMLHDAKMKPTEFVTVDSENTIRSIDVDSIVCVKESISPIKNTTGLASAITESSSGVVSVSSGLFEENLTIEKDTVIKGNKAGISASNLSLRNSDENETILTGKITVSPGATLTLDGVTLKGNASLATSGVEDISLKNVRLLELTPENPKSYIIKTTAGDSSKLVIKNCYFGNNPEMNGKKFYNLFELSGKLQNGSEFTNNYFAKEWGTHNCINIYDVEDEAYIYIADNIWEKSANAIRIGTKGDAKCVIDIRNNRYLETDEENPEYAGLVLVQPYGTQTTTMKNLKIFIENTYHLDEHQLYYLYAGPSDMQFTEFNKPTIVVDNEVVVSPEDESME